MLVCGSEINELHIQHQDRSPMQSKFHVSLSNVCLHGMAKIHKVTAAAYRPLYMQKIFLCRPRYCAAVFAFGRCLWPRSRQRIAWLLLKWTMRWRMQQPVVDAAAAAGNRRRRLLRRETTGLQRRLGERFSARNARWYEINTYVDDDHYCQRQVEGPNCGVNLFDHKIIQ